MASLERVKQCLPQLLQLLGEVERRLNAGVQSPPLHEELVGFAGAELGGVISDVLFGDPVLGKKLALGRIRDGSAKAAGELEVSCRGDVQRIATQIEGLIDRQWTEVQTRTIRKWCTQLAGVRTAAVGKRTTTLLRCTQKILHEILEYQPIATTGEKKQTQPARSRGKTPTAVANGSAVILLCTANAAHPNHRLRLEEELRAIDDALQRARRRELYAPRICPSVTFTKVIHELDDHEPAFVHFSGHGDRTGNLILKGEQSDKLLVSPARIAELLDALPRRPTLVTFATCHSRALAEAAARNAEFAIGFDGALDDDSAPLFSATLYERLASREKVDVARAFKLAVIACRAEGHPTVELARLYEYPGRAIR